MDSTDFNDDELKAALELSLTKPSNICFHCDKKLNPSQRISGKCRCENVYCSEHRINHPCAFDHHQRAKIILAKENQKMDAPRISQ